MPARLTALCHDRVDATLLERNGLGGRGGGAEDHAARLLDRLEGRDAEGEAEDRDARLDDDRELVVGVPGRQRRKRLLLRQAELGTYRREQGGHRCERLRVDRRRRQRDEEVHAERSVGQLSDGPIVSRSSSGESSAPAVDRAEPTHVGDRSHELGRDEAARHGGLHDRVARAQERSDSRRREHDRNLVHDLLDVVDVVGARRRRRPARSPLPGARRPGAGTGQSRRVHAGSGVRARLGARCSGRRGATPGGARTYVPGGPVHRLTADAELELACEHVERVAVQLVEVEVGPTAGGDTSNSSSSVKPGAVGP